MMNTSIALSLILFSSTLAHAKYNDEMVGKPATTPIVAPLLVSDPNDPSQGSIDQAKGFYSKGKLTAPNQLADTGIGYIKIARPRNRGFATFDLIYLLTQTSAELQRAYPNQIDGVQIADISQSVGGVISGHASHQNGLDVDVAFIRKNQTIQDPNDTTGFKESFVKGGKLTENFDMERNWAYAKILVATGRVQRVFVNEVVKKGFCEYAKSIGELEVYSETLRRLRPYSGHTDHYHIRVTCPLNSATCKAQEDNIPEGSGC